MYYSSSGRAALTVWVLLPSLRLSLLCTTSYSTLRTYGETSRRVFRIIDWNLSCNQSRTNTLGTAKVAVPSSSERIYVSRNQVLKLAGVIESSIFTNASSQSFFTSMCSVRTMLLVVEGCEIGFITLQTIYTVTSIILSFSDL